MDTSPKAQYDKQILVILSEWNERKIHLQRRQGIVILSLLQKGEKSTEFKTHFKFMDTSPKAQYDKDSVILSEWNERKIQINLRYTLNLWILRYAQYDKKIT